MHDNYKLTFYEPCGIYVKFKKIWKYRYWNSDTRNIWLSLSNL